MADYDFEGRMRELGGGKVNRTGIDAASFAQDLRDRAGDGSIDWVNQPIQAAALLDVADILDENEKLRELVRDVWQFTGTTCKKYPRLFDPPAQGGQRVQPNAIDFFEQRMRELGIEVPE